MSAMSDLDTQLLRLREQQRDLSARMEALLEQQRADTARCRLLELLIGQLLGRAEEEHAPSVGGAMELEDRQLALANLRVLLARGGGR